MLCTVQGPLRVQAESDRHKREGSRPRRPGQNQGRAARDRPQAGG